MGDLQQGSVLSAIPDGSVIGKRETPEDGFVWIEITGNTAQDCREFLDGEVIKNPDYVEIDEEGDEEGISEDEFITINERNKIISLDSPIPIHRRSIHKAHRKRVGKTIRGHLSKMVVPMKRSGLIIRGK